MPSRNRIKTYVKDGFYHVYNRGVAKQEVYLDIQDYKVFLKYLKEALSKPVIKKVRRNVQGRSFQTEQRLPKNFRNEVELISYCLMPNHFHLLLKQNNIDSMQSFMRSITTRYSMYFNKKYKRIGPLFQGRYKAVIIAEDKYLLHLTRYIHMNPQEYIRNLTDAYSSYSDYLGLKKTKWIKPDIVLKFFNSKTIPELSNINSYKSFVERYRKDSADILGELALE